MINTKMANYANMKYEFQTKMQQKLKDDGDADDIMIPCIVIVFIIIIGC